MVEMEHPYLVVIDSLFGNGPNQQRTGYGWGQVLRMKEEVVQIPLIGFVSRCYANPVLVLTASASKRSTRLAIRTEDVLNPNPVAVDIGNFTFHMFHISLDIVPLARREE